VRPKVAAFWSTEANALILEQGALDARVAERPASAQVPAGADDAVGRNVVRAVVHRPAYLAGASDAPQEPRDRSVRGDTAGRHRPHNVVHFFSETRHVPIVSAQHRRCSKRGSRPSKASNRTGTR
jgi:hypothetical protein